jgi:glycerate-2-kinase
MAKTSFIHNPVFSLPNLSKTKFYESAKHNLPDNLSIQNTQKILDFIDLDNTDKENILFIFLISGGASAVLCSPSDGISLEDKLKVIRLLASNGADITALNTVRIALSKIKGGRLAQRISPSKVCHSGYFLHY